MGRLWAVVRSVLPVAAGLVVVATMLTVAALVSMAGSALAAAAVDAYAATATPDGDGVVPIKPPVVAIPPPANTREFIARAVAPARESMRRFRVPASVTIAQAILESGSGRSTLTRLDHSLFGMKCFGGPGPVAIGCHRYSTHECDTHGCYATHASFRAYRTEADSYIDHGLALTTLARYRPALAYVGDPDRYALALQQAGYATSPTYAKNLISLMRRYNLYRYDHPAP